jgi:NAD(P)-dependent dehydrogenase (short-subunit alcohol dehydrogenase family)
MTQLLCLSNVTLYFVCYDLCPVAHSFSAEEAFHQYNTNVFGVLNVCRAVLPYMRAQRSGLVAIIGSVAAWRGYAATGLYCSSKAAAASISESLRGDVAHLGIEVTVVEPGYFRTSVLTTNHAYAKQRIADLEPATLPAKKEYARNAGKEAGDPVKGAKLLVELFTKTGRGEGRTLPARLVLGKGAVGIEHAILALREQELRDWEEIVSATDFDDL